MNINFDVVVIGAGAAGLMCAIEAGKRNKKVLIIEHTSKIAEKIRISGGGRCNFTNIYSNVENFLSNNKHFCKSAFSKYTQNNFIDLVKKHKIDQKNILGHSDIAPERKKDPGEKFPWEYLAKNKVGKWHSLNCKIIKKFRNQKIDTISQNLFLNNLFKIGYSKKTPKNIRKIQYLSFVIKAFQRRYRQELVNGKMDKECLIISKNLLNR